MRAIDADKVMEEINRIGGHNLCEWETLGVKALICRQDTLDVVPREAHEEVKAALDTAVKALANAMREAEENEKDEHRIMQETAREIFEEIEKWLPIIDYPIVAELKKKYTKE